MLDDAEARAGRLRERRARSTTAAGAPEALRRRDDRDPSVTARPAGRSWRRAWSGRCGAGGSSWRCSRSCCWRGALLAGAVGAVAGRVPGRVGAWRGCWRRRRRAGCWCGRCGCGGCGAGSGADGSTRACRPWGSGGCGAVPAGEVAAIRVASGGSIEDLDARRERLAASIGLRELRVTRDPADASRGTVTFVRRDPLAGTSSVPWPHATPRRCRCGSRSRSASTSSARSSRSSWWSATCSWAASRARASPPRSRCWSPRRRWTRRCGCGCWTASWSSCRRGRRARSASPAPTSARRSSCCASCARRWSSATATCSPPARARSSRGDGLPLHLVACDELAFYLQRRGPQAAHGAFAELLRDLVARGRAAGVIVCAATQKPAADVVPVRAAGPVRVPARAALQHAAGVGHDPRPGLGAAAGYNAATIAPGQRGVGLLLAEDGLPVRMRGFHLADDRRRRDRRARERAARRRVARPTARERAA